MKHLKNMITKAKKTFQSLVFKVRYRPSFETMAVEQLATKNIPAEKRESAIIDLRFKAWFNYHKPTANVLVKHKMRIAFHAGFRSSQIGAANEQ